MVSALWSNSNYDDDKGTRKEALETVEQQFKEAREIIYGRKSAAQIEEDKPFDENDPFMRPALDAMRGLEKPVQTPEEIVT